METLKDIKQTAITSIEDIWATLPKEIFQKNNLKATRTLLIPIVVCVIGYLSIAFLPWYLLPVGWLTVGLAAAGFFSVALSCSQQLLFSSKIINEIIGEVFLIPLMYPFAAWKQQHFGSANKIIKGRFWWLSSAWEWVVSTFNFGRLLASPRMAASFICLYTFAFIFFPLMAYFGGVWGLFKYYIIPYAIYHIWLSSFLKSKYNKVLDFNATRNWLEFLTNDLSFVMNSVSELSSQIPTYNLREAYQYIQEWYDKQGEAQSSFSQYEIILKSGSKIVLKKKIYSRSQAYKQLWTFLSKVNWPTTIFLIVVPGMAVYGLLTIEWQVPTFVFALVWYCCGGLSITAGYHRLFSHRAYEAAWPVRLFFALFGAGACEMSVFNWCADHRIHHRYTDTEKDPYSSAKGFFWAHMGWLMTKRDPVVNQARSMSDISDLKQDPILHLQHKFYLPLCLSMAFAVPTLIAGSFWGDWKGGFFISGCLTTSLIQHSTFCVNSVAHFFGDLTYSDQRTPRDAFWVSLLTFGEGYHNFHHEFPYDYRNGIHFYAWDPSKWLVRVLQFVGLAWDLKTFPAEVILKGRLQMEQKALDRKMAKVDWGPPENSLPFWTHEEFQQRVSKGDKLMIVNDFVHDVENFLEEHPAGSKIMKPFLGQDISKAFNGGVYNHSNAARNILCTLRVARLFDKKQL